MKFNQHKLALDLLVWLVVLNILLVLSVFFSDGIGVVHWPLGAKADPFAPPPAVIRPEWYFMFAFQALKFLPPHIGFIEGELFGILFFSIAAVLWGFVPFLDRKANAGKKSPLFTFIGIMVLIFIIVMTVLGYVLE